ncbi:MAG TPA: NAD(P)-binding domain-containing protein [Gaiellaceae bacterium]|nr:NAD(P)-binding domain-containing protein [Gaiellaceae bacterium]
MRIAILGGGRVGGGLAATWSEAGHDVTVSSRETVAETAAAGEVVVLAVPAAAASDVLAAAGTLAGKILVDATNNLSGGPDGAAVAALAPEARAVKAFNTVFATFFHDTPPERPASLLVSGDDPAAKEVVSGLVRDAGFEPVDAGGADRTADVEAFARLVIGIAYRQGRGPFVYRFESS